MKSKKQEKNQECKKAIDYIASQFDVFRKEIKNLKDEAANFKKKYDEYEQEKVIKNHPKKRVAILEYELDKQNQYSQKLNFLFDGMVESNQKETQIKMIDQFKKIGMEVKTTDIQVAHRIRKK